jgi:predicted O-methyltransferase YrrM
MISKISEYVNATGSDGLIRLSEIYGTESFCWFLHGLILMRKPQTLVELGTGAACTTCLAAYAAKLNGCGHVWTVDDGQDWALIREECQRAAGYENPRERYSQFIRRLLKRFRISEYVTLIHETTTSGNYFAPDEPIDILFFDLGDTGPVGCLSALRYYLPKMAHSSSIFIDRASTILPSRLLLRDIVHSFNRRRIPRSLIKDLDLTAIASIKSLVETCKFTLVDLVEPHRGKANPLQNSRLWLNIEVEDFLPPDTVASFMDGASTKPIKVPD